MKKLFTLIVIIGVALVINLKAETYVVTSLPCDYGSVVVCDRWRMIGDGNLTRWCHCEDEDSGHMTSRNWMEQISLAPQ